jgi:hypothetical protein
MKRILTATGALMSLHRFQLLFLYLFLNAAAFSGNCQDTAGLGISVDIERTLIVAEPVRVKVVFSNRTKKPILIPHNNESNFRENTLNMTVVGPDGVPQPLLRGAVLAHWAKCLRYR